MSQSITPNHREVIAIRDQITGSPFYSKGVSADGSLNVNITGGSASGTQYTDGQVAPAHPIGTIPVFNNGGTIDAVSVVNPLPVSATFSGSISTSPTFAQNPGAGSPTAAYGLIDSSFRPQVSVATALPAGANVIGHVITDTGSTTAVTGTVTVSGTVTTSPPSNASTNISQINAITPLMGNGVTGTGSLRVTVASDNTAFSVNSTLSAETTKVIGTVRTADGAGNLLTSNSTTYTAKFGLDNNLLGTLGTAFSTAGKVDIKGADGDVFVRQATASNLNATVVGTGTFAVQTTPTAPTTIFNGKKTVTTAGTRVTLAASQAVKSVAIKALSTNTGFIYVGDASVASTTGLQLRAGETVSLDIANLATVNLDSSVNGEGVTYIGTN